MGIPVKLQVFDDDEMCGGGGETGGFPKARTCVSSDCQEGRRACPQRAH